MVGARAVMLAAVTAVLWGCGGGASYTCSVEGVRSVEADHTIPCEVVQQNVALARSSILSRGAATEAELAATLAVTSIRIESVTQFEDSDGPFYGEYQGGSIRLTRDMKNLPHEMIHAVLEHKIGTPDAAHESPEWELNGSYRRANIDYGKSFTRLE